MTHEGVQARGARSGAGRDGARVPMTSG